MRVQLLRSCAALRAQRLKVVSRGGVSHLPTSPWVVLLWPPPCKQATH